MLYTWPLVSRWMFSGEKLYSASSPSLPPGLMRNMLLTMSSWKHRCQC